MQNTIDWNNLDWNNPVGGSAVEVASFTGKNEVFINYGIGVGDVISFPPIELLPKCRVEQTSKSLGKQISLLKVVRNDQPSYLAVGALSTTDANRDPVDDFRREMLDFQDAEMRVQHLCKKGATIKGVKKETKTMTDFKDGKPNGTIQKEIVVVSYV